MKKYTLSLMEPGKHDLPVGLSAAGWKLKIQGPTHWLYSEAAVVEVSLRRPGFGFFLLQVLSGECQGLMDPERLWKGRSWSLAFKEDVTRRGWAPCGPGISGDIHPLLLIGQDLAWACNKTQGRIPLSK